MTRIIHLTSAHPRDDTRILRKQCLSLASDGHDVHLVVADGQGDDRRANVHIHGVPKAQTRLRRMSASAYHVFSKAKGLRGDIYHLHDPELIPYGLLLRLFTRSVVVFDSHENIPAQILSKDYLHPITRTPTAFLFKLLEFIFFRFFHAIIAATPEIQHHLQPCHKKVILVQNFPSQNELLPGSETQKTTDSYICYIGGLTRIRGIETLVDAMNYVRSDVKLVLAGSFNDPHFRDTLMAKQGWQHVIFKSQIPFDEVLTVLKHAVAGIVVFQSKPNHIYSQPNKIFEYMGAGIPVIASNFPMWHSIISDSKSGICVTPEEPRELAAAIDKVASNKQRAIEMGRNGRKAVINTYNWEQQYANLSQIYKALAGEK